MGIKGTLRGRPRLGIPRVRIVSAVRRHGQVVDAAKELRCSQAYIHKRMKEADTSLGELLATQDREDRTK